MVVTQLGWRGRARCRWFIQPPSDTDSWVGEGERDSKPQVIGWCVNVVCSIIESQCESANGTLLADNSGVVYSYIEWDRWAGDDVLFCND